MHCRPHQATKAAAGLGCGYLEHPWPWLRVHLWSVTVPCYLEDRNHRWQLLNQTLPPRGWHTQETWMEVIGGRWQVEEPWASPKVTMFQFYLTKLRF